MAPCDTHGLILLHVGAMVADVLESCMMMWYQYAIAKARTPDLSQLAKKLEPVEQVCPFVHRILRHLKLMNKPSLVKST